jgi:hypothetical protein
MEAVQSAENWIVSFSSDTWGRRPEVKVPWIDGWIENQLRRTTPL